LYTYLPYLAVYLGATTPLLLSVAGALYGIRKFSEQNVINEIRVINDGGAHDGLLRIQVAISPFVSRSIIVNPRDVVSVISLDGDDLG
jgi:hypothetical protein